MDKRVGETIAIWREFAGRQKAEKIVLNFDLKKVELLAGGVIHNEESKGFKYCPCRLTTGNEKADVRLICPCNFKSQKTWRETGECWCSLFVKEK